MKRTFLLIVAAVLLSSGSCFAQSVTKSKSVQLTVYSGGFALVRDVRGVTLKKGTNSIEVEDVAAKIDPTSVLFKLLSPANAVGILEQNYQYDLISPDNILNKATGQKVTFTQFDINGKPFTESGILLAPPANGGVVIQTDSGSIVLRPYGQVSLQKMPEGLHPKPTLNWLLHAADAITQDAQISYITEGAGWKADYVALINKDDTELDLNGWVSLNNDSGATYSDAKLTLIAGDVRRVRPVMKAMSGMGAAYASPEASVAFEEKSFFEYHMYTMQRSTTIRNNETKQLSLLSASNAKVRKEMIFDPRRQWWSSWWYPGRMDMDPGAGYDTGSYHKVNVVIELQNSKENNMGMPLPKGNIRVYKLDDDGTQQFIGEDSIDHTPKDEKIRLYLGDAFDVVGDYKRTKYSKVSSNVIEESFEVKIRNHKNVPADVKVVDHVWSDWKVTQSSAKYEKVDAHTIQFPVTVPKDGETVITYTIRTSW
jgi:hypothetical protein